MAIEELRFDAEVYRGQEIPEAPEPDTGSDPLAIDGFDHIEIFCANAKQTAFYFCKAFGFQPYAYRGPETGWRESVSHVLLQNDVCLKISAPLGPEHEIGREVLEHGQTVTDVAFKVPNAAACYFETLRRGAVSAASPRTWSDAGGNIASAAIRTYGNVRHTFVERDQYSGNFWPGFAPYAKVFSELKSDPIGLQNIDHVVGNVELGKMDEWVSFYEKILGFKEMLHFSDDDISTEYSALMSKVLNGGKGKIKMPINEPAEGKRKSQIEEYLDFHRGPGVQHVAIATNDIIKTVSELRNRGVQFLRVPGAYYEALPERVGHIKEDLKRIGELGILVDRDDDGYLLQIFTKPLQDRPTLFFEIIQREGSQGFGKGNFKALFEAIEREQELRGNL